MPKHPVKRTALKFLEDVTNPVQPLSFAVPFNFSKSKGLLFFPETLLALASTQLHHATSKDRMRDTAGAVR
ncbi:hypothetical protein, conserved [Leishmania donovani]|uniref:Uncharacterized protein n=1 Tax=Leishmania donovani TaxID=5661 RepID=E9BFT1_LEIDO|nr:hypothetical protein, conserved [Leishmania donovani]CBZ34107.1 hypothetical protein, conserved [Leishmania donovani]